MADTALKALAPDYTGKSLQNRIEKELHSIQFGQDKPFFFPRYTPFYREGLKVYNQQTGAVYEEGKHYVLGHSYPEASQSIGRSVFGSIVFIDQSVAKLILVDYQALGGGWGVSEKDIAAELANRAENPIVRTYGQLNGQRESFPPVDHDQDLSDVKDMDAFVRSIYAVVAALEASAQGVNADHLADHDNPHKTTKVQVGLGNVQDFPIATETSARAGVSREEYLTPYLGKLLVDAFTQVYKDHMEDKKNPHNVTKDTVGLGKVENFAIASQDEALAGASNTTLMTPHLVYEMIKTLGANNLIEAVKTSLDAHLSNHENPHGVTAAQLGVYTRAAVDALLLDVKSKDTARFGSMTVNEWRHSLPSHQNINDLLLGVANAKSESVKKINTIQVVDGKLSNRVRPIALFGSYQGYTVKTNKNAFVQVGRHYIDPKDMDGNAFYERREAAYFIDKDGLIHHNGEHAARPPVAYRPGSQAPAATAKPVKVAATDLRGYIITADKSVFTWNNDASELTDVRQARAINTTPGIAQYVVVTRDNNTAVALGSKEFVDAVSPLLAKETNVLEAYVNDNYLLLIYTTGTLGIWRIDTVDNKPAFTAEPLNSTLTDLTYIRANMGTENFILLSRDNRIRGYGPNRNGEVSVGTQFIEVQDVVMSDNFSVVLDRQWGLLVIGDADRTMQPPKLNQR